MYTPAPTAPASPYGWVIPPATTEGEAPGPDLTVFLLAHRVFRREFARLAVAAEAITAERDAPLTDAIEEQIAMMARSLHKHHTSEDEEIWPVIRKHDPASAIVLDALEQEHTKIDPLITMATDRSVPLRHRAVVLDELSDLLNRLLDREEAEGVPLILRHFTKAGWEADGKAHTRKMRKDLPAFVCTMIDHMSEDEVAELMRTGPKLLVVLYKLSWRRRWAQLRPQIYGRERS